MTTLHVHADESGDLNFTSGSPYYVFSVVWTETPSPLARDLRCQRFSWCRDGHDIARFHAGKEKRGQRYHIYNLMMEDESWTFSSLVVRKASLYAPLKDPEAFYPKFLSMALRFVFRGRIRDHISRVLVYTDRLPDMNAARHGVEKAIKTACAADLKPRGIPFHIFHHPSASNKWLQVADYCCWAVQRKYHQDDDTWYNLIDSRLAAPELVLWP